MYAHTQNQGQIAVEELLSSPYSRYLQLTINIHRKKSKVRERAMKHASNVSYLCFTRSPAFAVGVAVGYMQNACKAAISAGKRVLKPLQWQDRTDSAAATPAVPMVGRRLSNVLQTIFLCCALDFMSLESVGKLMSTCTGLNLAVKHEDAIWSVLLKYCRANAYDRPVIPGYHFAKQAAHFKILSRQWGITIDTCRYFRVRSASAADDNDDDDDEEEEVEDGDHENSLAAPMEHVFEVDDPVLKQQILTMHSDLDIVLQRKTGESITNTVSVSEDSMLELMNRSSPCFLGRGWWCAVTREFLLPKPSSSKKKLLEGTVSEWNMLLYDMSACAGKSDTNPAFWFVKPGRKARVGCIVLKSDGLSSEVCVASGTHVESMYERVMPLCTGD